MKTNKRTNSLWVLGLPVLVIVIGVTTTAFLFRRSGITQYPAIISNAFHDDRHHLQVPGSRVVHLSRKGAYGIYFETSSGKETESFPKTLSAITCSLTSKSTGKIIEAVPDYVPTNRYSTKGQNRTGVLVMSITLDDPGTYTFTCYYPSGKREPEIEVALGPNYFWEFFRVAWKISLPLITGIITLCGSVTMALVIVLVILIIRRPSPEKRLAQTQ